jgi:hypothetical protein
MGQLFLKIITNETSRKSVQWVLSCSVRTDRRTGKTKLMFTVRRFAKAPNKSSQFPYVAVTYIYIYVSVKGQQHNKVLNVIIIVNYKIGLLQIWIILIHLSKCNKTLTKDSVLTVIEVLLCRRVSNSVLRILWEFFLNVDKHSPNDTVSPSKIFECSVRLLWEPQISHSTLTLYIIFKVRRGPPKVQDYLFGPSACY